MRHNNRLARLFRALSGETQRGFAQKTGVHPTLLADYELDQVEPSSENLEKLARGAGLAVEDGEAILRRYEEMARPRQRAGEGIGDVGSRVAASVSSVYDRFLKLPPSEKPPPSGSSGGATE